MNIRPLTQLREMIAAALRSQTNIGKSFPSFFIETMELFLTHTGRLNFTQMARCGRSCESRFRDDVRLRYLYAVPKLHKRGRPQKYAGKVDLKNLDMSVFAQEQVSVDMKSYTLYSAVVNAVSLDRDVKVVIADSIEDGGKRQSRKVFFSTDTSMSSNDIFEIYKTRFQLEFFFRDAKQFTGLTHCQARHSEALSFAFNAPLTSVNIARAFAHRQGMYLSVGSTKTLLHNAAMVERFISMS